MVADCRWLLVLRLVVAPPALVARRCGPWNIVPGQRRFPVRFRRTVGPWPRWRATALRRHGGWPTIHCWKSNRDRPAGLGGRSRHVFIFRAPHHSAAWRSTGDRRVADRTACRSTDGTRACGGPDGLPLHGRSPRGGPDGLPLHGRSPRGGPDGLPLHGRSPRGGPEGLPVHGRSPRADRTAWHSMAGRHAVNRMACGPWSIAMRRT